MRAKSWETINCSEFDRTTHNTQEEGCVASQFGIQMCKTLHLAFGGTCRKLEVGWAKISGCFAGDLDGQDDRLSVAFDGGTTGRVVRTNNIERRDKPACPPRVLSTFPCASGSDDTTTVSLLLSDYSFQIVVNGECIVDANSLDDPDHESIPKRRCSVCGFGGHCISGLH